MRPLKSRQSGLRAPLNRIFGTEANVRILRVISLDPEPMTRTELARRAGLEVKGAHLAANRLLQEGIIQRVGGGGLQNVVLVESHPLANAIKALFNAERERADRLIDELRNTAKHLSPDVDSAWIHGEFATGHDRLGDAVTMAVLTPASVTARLSKALREAVTPIEALEDVTIDTKVYTRPDLLTLSPDEKKAFSNILLLFGPDPTFIIEGGAQRNPSRTPSLHSKREAEQRELAEAIVRHLRRNPAKRRLALDYIAKRSKNASPHERHELEEWKAILESSSNARLERLLTDPGERATRLRQTLPFMKILSADERNRLLTRLRHDPA